MAGFSLGSSGVGGCCGAGGDGGGGAGCDCGCGDRVAEGGGGGVCWGVVGGISEAGSLAGGTCDSGFSCIIIFPQLTAGAEGAGLLVY